MSELSDAVISLIILGCLIGLGLIYQLLVWLRTSTLVQQRIALLRARRAAKRKQPTRLTAIITTSAQPLTNTQHGSNYPQILNEVKTEDSGAMSATAGDRDGGTDVR